MDLYRTWWAVGVEIPCSRLAHIYDGLVFSDRFIRKCLGRQWHTCMSIQCKTYGLKAPKRATGRNWWWPSFDVRWGWNGENSLARDVIGMFLLGMLIYQRSGWWKVLWLGLSDYTTPSKTIIGLYRIFSVTPPKRLSARWGWNGKILSKGMWLVCSYWECWNISALDGGRCYG